MSKRSRILVDPAVQWSIAGRIVLHWLLLLICLLTINIMVQVLTSAGQMSFGEALVSALMSQTKTLGVTVLLLPVFLRDTLKLSNRFAGPMYRLRMALKSVVSEGTVKPIKFRGGDFWQDAAEDFNRVIAKYDALTHENAKLRAELEALRQEQVAV